MSKWRRFSLIMLTLMMLAGSLVGLTGHSLAAGGQDVSDRVTDLQIVNSETGQGQAEYPDGARMTLTGQFSDQAGKIHAGDYIKVAWTADADPATACVKGFAGSKDLEIDGLNVGRYEVSESGAVLTFNQNIEKFTKEVHGDFSFEVVGRNLDQRDHFFTFSSGQAAAVVTASGQGAAPSDRPQKQAWDSEKVGDMRSDYASGRNYIMWGLYLNSNRAYLDGDITVSDPMPAGTELDPASVWVEIDGRRFSLAEFGQAFPGAEIAASNNALNCRFDQADFSARKVMVCYQTTVTNLTEAKFDNEAAISYRLQGQSEQTTTAGKTVKNIAFDAHVYGTKPKELKIVKLDADEKTPIKGVEFSVIGPDSQRQELATDENGIIDLTDLAPGDYQVQETKAASGYDLADRVHSVKVSAAQDGQALVVYNHKSKIKESIPWTTLTPAKKTVPWTSLVPAKKTVPWTPLTPAKTIPIDDKKVPAGSGDDAKPWLPLTPAKKTVPWTSLTPAKKIVPWTPLTPANTILVKDENEPAVPAMPAASVPAEPIPALPQQAASLPVKDETGRLAVKSASALAADPIQTAPAKMAAKPRASKPQAAKQAALPQTGSQEALLIIGFLAVSLSWLASLADKIRN